mmetsp:Transcript_184307/g.584487  ORF Transcript_184307/g.584487 Transcript_184307/m.584487 type:complete len:126 (+) Transcript_184307:1702-2079(+)
MTASPVVAVANASAVVVDIVFGASAIAAGELDLVVHGDSWTHSDDFLSRRRHCGGGRDAGTRVQRLDGAPSARVVEAPDPVGMTAGSPVVGLHPLFPVLALAEPPEASKPPPSDRVVLTTVVWPL